MQMSEKIQKSRRKIITAFCTCPSSGNQVDGLPLALVKMLCQLVALGPVERANMKFIKKCLTLI